MVLQDVVYRIHDCESVYIISFHGTLGTVLCVYATACVRIQCVHVTNENVWGWTQCCVNTIFLLSPTV